MVLPCSLGFRPPVRSAKGNKVIDNTDFSFLRFRFDQCQQSLRSFFSRSISELSALIEHFEIAWVE